MHRGVHVALAVTLGAICALSVTERASAQEGMDILCDRADYGCVAGTGYKGQGVWGANYGKTGHNCTSYVSYRLKQLGVSQPWRPMGDANRWDDNAKGRVAVDDIPAVGAVAQWEGGTRLAPGPQGHVGYVEAVTAEGIEVTDDTNACRTRRYRIRRGSPYWPDDFVHIHDVAAPAAVEQGRWAFTNAKQPPFADAIGLEFGTPGDVPVVGDWDGDGDDTAGTFRDGAWTLVRTHEGKLRTMSLVFGQAGDVPVVGDWDGDGDDSVGVYRDGTWVLSNSLSTGPETTTVIQLGQPGDQPVVGDWDGVGGDTVGVFRDGTWTLTNAMYTGLARQFVVQFGSAGDRGVAGNWDGVRGDTIGVFRDGTWLFPRANNEVTGVLSLVVFGGRDSTPLVGNWDGQGSDTVGVAR